MADDVRRDGGPGELIYLPEPSWYPILIAAGIAGIAASLFVWWPYGVLGAIVALLAAGAWIREARESFGRLPRRQRTVTATLPAVPLRRRGE